MCYIYIWRVKFPTRAAPMPQRSEALVHWQRALSAGALATFRRSPDSVFNDQCSQNFA